MGAGCACLSQALSEVISVPFRLERRGLVLRFPLAVSAAMGVFCVCEPDRAAVLDREPLPCACGVWGRLVTCAGAKLRHIAPARPASLAPGFASLPGAPLPPTKSAEQGHAQRKKFEGDLRGEIRICHWIVTSRLNCRLFLFFKKLSNRCG
jgi:hypothetical protein